jgi:hypothetical protein
MLGAFPAVFCLHASSLEMVLHHTIESFVSGTAHKIIKVKVVKQDAFSFIEMASRAKLRLEGRL